MYLVSFVGVGAFIWSKGPNPNVAPSNIVNSNRILVYVGHVITLADSLKYVIRQTLQEKKVNYKEIFCCNNFYFVAINFYKNES